MTVPDPPARLAPPMITAAKTGKVRLLPDELTCVEPRNENSMIPASAAIVEQITNAIAR